MEGEGEVGYIGVTLCRCVPSHPESFYFSYSLRIAFVILEVTCTLAQGNLKFYLQGL